MSKYNVTFDRLLGGTMKLGDMDDVEAYAHHRARRYINRYNIPYQQKSVDYDELVTHVITALWELYDSKWNGKDSFVGYASSLIEFRITDYFRARFGKDGEQVKSEQLVSPFGLGEAEPGEPEYNSIDSSVGVRGILLS